MMLNGYFVKSASVSCINGKISKEKKAFFLMVLYRKTDVSAVSKSFI